MKPATKISKVMKEYGAGKLHSGSKKALPLLLVNKPLPLLYLRRA